MHMFLLTPLLLSTIAGMPAGDAAQALRSLQAPVVGGRCHRVEGWRSRQEHHDIDLAGTRLRVAWREERGVLKDLRVRRLAGPEPLVCASWRGTATEPGEDAAWFAFPQDVPHAIRDLPVPGMGEAVWLRLVAADGSVEQLAFYPGG